MLSRYKIYRGARPKSDPKPKGVCQDARWRCVRHPLHPPQNLVEKYLAAPGEEAWRAFRRAYMAELERRLKSDRAPFDKLAALATSGDLYIGCSCPTKANPRVDHCHTFVALEFMKKKYPRLSVILPEPD
jgi:uncharacterized protein YeaO (DUF488 family)